jgi:uncharacterized membrane protein YgcG
MLKINLLPSHILETRRVKAWVRILIVVLVVELLLAFGYIWGPAPLCLRPKQSAADARWNKANADSQEVQKIQADVTATQGRYANKNMLVTFVSEADRIPAKWQRWVNLWRKYIPSDVVLSALPPPNSTMTFVGYTSDWRAAARWYLNMLRCEMLNYTGPESISFSVPTVGWPGELPTGANPKMQTQCSISMAIRPEFLDMLALPAPPASLGGGAVRVGGRGGMGGGRMGGGRGGGGGMGGGRGGGGRMGGRRGG